MRSLLKKENQKIENYTFKIINHLSFHHLLRHYHLHVRKNPTILPQSLEGKELNWVKFNIVVEVEESKYIKVGEQVVV